MSSRLRDAIAGIIVDATDRDGVNADWAAARILAIPEIAEALAASVTVHRIPADADGRMIGQPSPVELLSREELERRYPPSDSDTHR